MAGRSKEGYTMWLKQIVELGHSFVKGKLQEP